ncbi:2441_t:CDS:2 [Funneliformis geosporum]|uniref:(d)CMP kinase n=1 Tax=Funneliformis geosporum TaxID=1117311 RepID=A0A9W4SUY7_9GLOM|nr:2441_t:CDS:2 [Funneliformis geosporum]CAI2181522.1 20003_t:CDS:2 [Funneliformis geosporum]
MLKINIAIDGSVGSGKTTIGRLLAERLNYQFLDSGLLYRHFALFYQQNNPLEWLEKNKEKVVSNLEKERQPLSSPMVSDLASRLSPQPELRKIILEFQRKLVQEKGWVVVGRDITSEVLPEAKVKVFLTASLEERTIRRSNQYKEKLSSKEVRKELQARDERDKERKISPLIKTPDSWELDTTHLSPIESVEKIIQQLEKKTVNKR